MRSLHEADGMLSGSIECFHICMTVGFMTQLKQYGSCYFLDTPSLGCTIKSVFTGCVMIWSRLERVPLSLEVLRRHRLRHTHSHTHTEGTV